MDVSLLTFALLALVVVMTPGPTVLLALSNGSRFGLATASFGIAGAAISDAVLITAAGLGLGAVFATSATLFIIVKWIGVGYLVWIGAQMLRSAAGPDVRDCRAREAREGRRLAVFRKSFLIAVTNPKGVLFFTAFLPQFLVLSEPLPMQYLTLAIVFVAVDMAVMTAYAALGARAMQVLSNRGAVWLDRSCGALLITLGGALALMRRGNP